MFGSDALCPQRTCVHAPPPTTPTTPPPTASSSNRFTLWFGAGVPWRQYQVRASGAGWAGTPGWLLQEAELNLQPRWVAGCAASSAADAPPRKPPPLPLAPQLIKGDGVHLAAYATRTFDGVAQGSHLAADNYFYLNCLTGGWAGDGCSVLGWLRRLLGVPNASRGQVAEHVVAPGHPVRFVPRRPCRQAASRASAAPRT